jgi:2-phospho-L-lactate/phosphoenolpyruvate guanylyltransferase
MRTLAILPMKSFAGAKQRLEPELAAGPRGVLAEAMFSDVLTALRRATAVDEVLVVTGDLAAQRIAGGHGATVLDDHDDGHNAAAAAGIRYALETGVERALLVPGDCPMLDPAELDQLLARPAGPESALIVPDRHGTGTNALVLTPPNSLAPAFGPGSCQRHAANAQAEGTEHEVVDVPSLGLDIDTPEDLHALQERLAVTRGNAAHTRGMLSQMARSMAE